MSHDLHKEHIDAVNKRIAKNTIALYARMMFAMVISLYTSRVVLQVLGVEDFGVYGIVGGIVTLFAFVNNTLVSSIQRFLNYEIGRDKCFNKGVTSVFSAGCQVQVLFAICIFLLSETVGLYYLNHYIKLPQNRLLAAQWVYQFSILVAISNIVRAPFVASVIAYERMAVYALVGIVEVCLKLVIVYLLLVLSSDRLVAYASLIALVSIGVTGYYIYYSLNKFKLCKIQLITEKSLIKRMLSFSGWNIFGSFSLLMTFQGVDLIINYFYGVVVNAAMTIANQVYAAANSLTSNFQVAFNPQITKTYAKGDMNGLYNLVYRTTRYSFFLVIICALPLLYKCGSLLKIWLDTVPQYAEDFCGYLIAVCVIDSVAAPLWMSVQATGKIRLYQIVISCILFLNFPITLACLSLGLSPVWAVVIRLIVSIFSYIYRIIYMISKLNMSILLYWKKVLLPCAYVLIPSILLIQLVNYYVKLNTIIETILYMFIVVVAILVFGVSNVERIKLKEIVLSKLR